MPGHVCRFGISAQTVGAIKSGKRGAAAIDDELRARMLAATPAAVALDETAARQVMAALEAGRSGAAIAEEFGISPSMVSAIKHGQAWAALDPELPADDYAHYLEYTRAREKDEGSFSRAMAFRQILSNAGSTSGRCREGGAGSRPTTGRCCPTAGTSSPRCTPGVSTP